MNMGFLNTNIESKQPLVPTNFTNAICYGQTGSGKTTGFMLPNIENRIKLNHGILIYDFKGNFHEQIKYIAKKYNKLSNIHEIGKPWGEKINILNHSTSRTLQSMFNSVSGNNITDNDYWNNSAYNLFQNLYFSLKGIKDITDTISTINNKIIKLDTKESLQNYYPNIKNISKIIKSPEALKKFIKELNQKIAFFTTIIKTNLIEYSKTYKQKQTIMKFLTLLSKLEEISDNLQGYKNLSNSTDNSNSGNNAVLQVLNNTIISIAHKECFNQDQFDIVNNLLAGKIIIIDVSSFNTEMLNFLNLSIYTRLIRQTSLSTKKNKITIFIDEAQKVINHNSMPDVDICRENKFEFILSTQDKILLNKQIDSLNMEILLKNITYQFSFKTTTPQNSSIDTSKLDNFQYVEILNNKKYTTNPIFIEKNDLFDVEYEYQKNINAKKLINISTKKKFILKYYAEIYEDYKALIFYKTTKTYEIVDIYFDTKLLDEIKNEIDSNNIDIDITSIKKFMELSLK